MEVNQKVMYREVQRPRQVWIWIVNLLTAAFSWYCFIQQIFLENPIGTNPAPDIVMVIFWLIFGVLFPVVSIGYFKLMIEVREDGLYICFKPFHWKYREFLFTDIINYEPIDYDASEFGGRGIRFNLRGETVYSMNGNKGIRLKLKYETVVISTESQSEIIKAMKYLTEEE